MNEQEVKIVELEPLRVLSFHGFGTEPEHAAFEKLQSWAAENEVSAETITRQRLFGFNNPNPSEGSPNYGYEVWITVGPEIEEAATAEGIDGEIKQFDGGLYAVLRTQPGNGEEIGENWQRLVKWLDVQPYQHASHQWLEEHIWPAEQIFGAWEELTMDLYAPVAEA